jgi:DNA-binding transcriptional regulator YiaG
MGRSVNNELFSWSGEDARHEPYAYTVCGLDSIFLLNGYKISIHDGEESVAVVDVDGLHRTIGRHLVMHRKGLAPKEVRFLRKTMDLTQAELAAKLGNDAQSVARWEKGICEMPGTAEKLLRATFLAENISNDGDLETLRKLLVSVMDELDMVDEVKPAQAQFKLKERWSEAPLLAA